MARWDYRMTLAALAFGWLSGVGTNVGVALYNNAWALAELSRPQPSRYAVRVVHYTRALEDDLYSLKTLVPFSSLVAAPERPVKHTGPQVRYAALDAEAVE